MPQRQLKAMRRPSELELRKELKARMTLAFAVVVMIAMGPSATVASGAAAAAEAPGDEVEGFEHTLLSRASLSAGWGQLLLMAAAGACVGAALPRAWTGARVTSKAEPQAQPHRGSQVVVRGNRVLSAEELAQLRVPKHMAVIMDGNRRYGEWVHGAGDQRAGTRAASKSGGRGGCGGKLVVALRRGARRGAAGRRASGEKGQGWQPLCLSEVRRWWEQP